MLRIWTVNVLLRCNAAGAWRGFPMGSGGLGGEGVNIDQRQDDSGLK